MVGIVRGRRHSSSPAEIDPGLAEALVTPAFGLVVAIPATPAYNYFMRRRCR